MKVLIVDDNKQITSILEEYAKKEGYETIVAFNGEEAIELFEKEEPEIILLDVMMPKKDGFTVCREIREISNVPIIMITAKGEDYEKIMGLEMGADDYILKPFSPNEVMARIKAIMRRITIEEKESNICTYDNLTISLDNYSASIDGKDLSLTKKELEILWTLATNKNKVFSRDNLLESIWGIEYYGYDRTVDSHMKRLRAKIDKYKHDKWDIKTIWGVGYKFEVEDEK